MTQPKVAIIILDWGDPAHSKACLESLGTCGYPNFHVFFVDQTLKYPNPLPDYATKLTPPRNLGYSPGSNFGMDHVDDSYDYVLLLNNDTTIEPGFLTKLVDALEATPRAAAAGPTILAKPSGRIWYGGGELNTHAGTTQHWRVNDEWTAPAEPQTEPVSFITGCSPLLRRAAVKAIGDLDERCFLYWEDADWCARAAAKGWQLLYVPDAIIHHSVSTGLNINSPNYLYYNIRNRLLFIGKNTPAAWKPYAWLRVGETITKELIKVAVRYHQNYLAYPKMMFRGIRDYRQKRFGAL